MPAPAVLQDFVCPRQCGGCCREGTPTRPFANRIEELAAVHRMLPCDHLGPAGCQLPREDRPWVCRVYLCLDAQPTEPAEARAHLVAWRAVRAAAARGGCQEEA